MKGFYLAKRLRDGRTTAGTEVPDGTYFYIINATDINDLELLKTGSFSLIR